MVEFNRLPCPNDDMHDDKVFADRLRYQLTMFKIPALLWLSRLLRARIACGIAVAKITADICRISHCLTGFE